MGYDIGFHAIDKNDMDDMSSYILGKTDALSLLPAAVNACRSRFIANAWGLGISQYANQLGEAHRQKIKIEIEKSKPGFIGKLFGKKPKEDDYSWIDQSAHTGLFNKDLHIWGRPFLIADTEHINELIQKYLAATAEETEKLALTQINSLKPGLADLVSPDAAELPGNEQFEQNSRWKIDFIRNAYVALMKGELIETPDGDELEPAELFAGDLHFSLVETAAIKQPTWMARGYVWPSLLLSNVNADSSFFETASILLPELENNLSEINYTLDSTIMENYTLGGVVAPNKLDLFKRSIENNSQQIIAKADEDNWGEDCKLVLQKINECIDYCRDNDLYFVESSDIYSGVLGVIS